MPVSGSTEMTAGLFLDREIKQAWLRGPNECSGCRRERDERSRLFPHGEPTAGWDTIRVWFYCLHGLRCCLPEAFFRRIHISGS